MKKNPFAAVLFLFLAVILLSGPAAGASARDGGLTRGELAAILADRAGLAHEQGAYGQRTSVFSDVAEGSEYEGWINLAWEKGLVRGDETGRFFPENKVSQVEAAAMILRLTAMPDGVLRCWPGDYSAAARSTGLTQGFSFRPEEAATEDMVRQMLHNAAAMADKPFIGLPWREGQPDRTRLHEIVALARGVAVELPRVAEREGGDMMARQMDGLLIVGDEDGTAYRDLEDPSDCLLIQGALAEGTPMLCIGRGMELLNAACGGKLISDLKACLGNGSAAYDLHRGGPEVDYTRHDVEVEAGSRWLKEIVGGGTLSNAASRHGGAIDPEGVGAGLTVAAYGPEGVVEAVEYRANSFALGLQFHPERDVLSDDALGDVTVCLGFFEMLVSFASEGTP